MFPLLVGKVVVAVCGIVTGGSLRVSHVSFVSVRRNCCGGMDIDGIGAVFVIGFAVIVAVNGVPVIGNGTVLGGRTVGEEGCLYLGRRGQILCCPAASLAER